MAVKITIEVRDDFAEIVGELLTWLDLPRNVTGSSWRTMVKSKLGIDDKTMAIAEVETFSLIGKIVSELSGGKAKID